MKLHANPFIKSALFISALCQCGYTYGNVEKKLQYTSKLSEGNKVEFSGINSNVNIVKGTSDTVVYDIKMVYKKNDKVKAEKTFDKIKWTFTEENTIHLEEEIKKNAKFRHLKTFVTISLPDGYPLNVNTVNGYIKTKEDFQTDLTVSTVNGDIKLEGNMGGYLNATNVNGLILAQNIDKECTVNTVNGNIELGNVKGDLKTGNVNGKTSIEQAESGINSNSVNGSICLNLTPKTTGPVKLKSVNGRLKVNCPEELGTTITARSNNGSLSCDKTLKISKRKKGKLEGTSGDGSVSLKIKSNNGNVTIETY